MPNRLQEGQNYFCNEFLDNLNVSILIVNLSFNFWPQFYKHKVDLKRFLDWYILLKSHLKWAQYDDFNLNLEVVN